MLTKMILWHSDGFYICFFCFSRKMVKMQIQGFYLTVTIFFPTIYQGQANKMGHENVGVGMLNDWIHD